MIDFDSANRCFHLHNDFLSFVLALRQDEEGDEELMTVYAGAPLRDAQACLYMLKMKKDGASFDSERQILPYACPTEGRGDYRPVMVDAKEASGQHCTELFYAAHRMIAGKPQLTGLPATYTEQDSEASTLLITLQDKKTGLEAELAYTLYADRPVITQSVRLTNAGGSALTLEQAASLCLTLPGRYDLVHLHGAWARERAVERVAPAALTRVIASSRGASGHEHNPFAALLCPDATEFQGECWGVNLVYSGDFAIQVDENAYNSTRLVTGLNPRTFEWRLRPGETFQTPEAVLVYSGAGLNGMSQAFHSLYRARLCRGAWRDRERPVLINNWEATYFGFNHDKIIKIARAASELGVELFVLDDGWFGKRDDDHSSLGDWVVYKKKLPDGLDALAREINGLGMRFGLWFEPEMISPDSELYRAHPDWCLHAEGRRRTTARWQLILDMSREDVQQYVIDAVSAVLRSAPIHYVKWDMNRNFKEYGSALLTDGREGEVAHRYMLGVYRAMDAVTKAFPDVLFESCSGGGGRFDAGILAYMPQTWTSDDTDAVERMFIQYGTSVCYPISAMGSHVSAVPNHQVGRLTDIKTRGEVAMGGNFGYELDLSAQTPEDLEEIRRQVQLVKRIRRTTQQGVYTRLRSPFEGNVAAWQFADDKRVILCAYRVLCKPNGMPERILLRDVPEGTYRAPDGTAISANELIRAGVRVDFTTGDFKSAMLIFERV